MSGVGFKRQSIFRSLNWCVYPHSQNRYAIVSVYGNGIKVQGFGDQESFGDTYLDGMGELYEASASRAAKVVGKTSVEGYNHSASRAVVDGAFCGLALDDVNEADKTDARIDAWVKQISTELA